jgi:4-hydroxythreonine-4-phosphate dehydrogenase
MNGAAPIAITMGDPAGIGPELTSKAWLSRKNHDLPPFVYIGCPEALKILPNYPPFKIISNLDDCVKTFENFLPVLEISTTSPITLGTLNKANSLAVVEAIKRGVNLTLAKECRALVTGPIQKSSLYDVGFKFAGHTGFLADLTATPPDQTVMMLASPELKVVPVTVHMALKDVASHLTTRKMEITAKVLIKALKEKFGINDPKIAVSALNPHAGEGGAMGQEETSIISPAIEALKKTNINIEGPYSADSLFTTPMRKTYDVALCMYHDQALIPLKTLDFQNGVNITLGIPIIRTSPDHGTALNIAGLDMANIGSMIAAIKMADQMSQNDA